MADPSSGMSAHAAAALLRVAQFASKLKSVPRTGWLDRGIPPLQVESVADHSLGVALLAWGCALQRRAEGVAINPERVLTLAILHDLAEAETGDVPPYDPAAIPDEHEPAARRAFLETRHRRDPVRDAAKRIEEDAAMRSFWHTLPGATRSALQEVWDDLRLGTSSEARFVKQVDRLEPFCSPGATCSAIPRSPWRRFIRKSSSPSMIHCSPPSATRRS